jgi:predicted transcriptional regulator
MTYYIEKYANNKSVFLVGDALLLLLCMSPVITYVHYLIYGYPIIYEEMLAVYNTNIKIGHYSDYKVYPTCGIASKNALIGEVDDTRYFSHPDRYNAEILWFTKGYIEYEIPNFIPYSQKITQIMISAELSSEAPGVNNVWPSDISFYINDVCVGNWTSPGDFGDVRGIFTPDWWFPNWNQYGLLKMLVINKNGTYIDGLKISDVNIDQFKLDYQSKIKFRMAVNDDAEHVGGLTIFGSSFGNYGQDIKVSLNYTPISNAYSEEDQNNPNES